jgi:hypothetical protein
MDGNMTACATSCLATAPLASVVGGLFRTEGAVRGFLRLPRGVHLHGFDPRLMGA